MYAQVKNSDLIVYPYTVEQLRLENPFTNYGLNPDVLAIFPETETAIANGYTLAEVIESECPAYNARTHKAVKDNAPRLRDGVWDIGWTVSEKSPEEIEAADEAKGAEMRAERNGRLAACDWTQLADAPVNSLAWANYRQALRDVPEQAGFPWNVIWPAEPA